MVFAFIDFKMASPFRLRFSSLGIMALFYLKAVYIPPSPLLAGMIWIVG
jgi:hypothetical protein